MAQQNRDTATLNSIWTRIGHKKNLEVERWQPQDFNYCLIFLGKRMTSSNNFFTGIKIHTIFTISR